MLDEQEKIVGTEKVRKSEKPIAFDAVFSEDSTQHQVFETAAEPLVDACCNGCTTPKSMCAYAYQQHTCHAYTRSVADMHARYWRIGRYNGTVFAYGQTSSGKTYTMNGTEMHPGIMYRTFDHLFEARTRVLHQPALPVWRRPCSHSLIPCRF